MEKKYMYLIDSSVSSVDDREFKEKIVFKRF